MLEDSWEGQVCNPNAKTKDTSKQEAQEQTERKKGAADLGAVLDCLEGKGHKHRNPDLTEGPGRYFGLGGQEVL